MDKIDNYMSAIEDILAKQSESECRKNVFETLDSLKAEFPSEQERINNNFKKLCKKYNKDFFNEIR